MEEHLQQTEENAASFALSRKQDSGMLAEWSVVENKLNSGHSGQLDGFIVARLPELDSNTIKVEPKETKQNIPKFGYLRKVSGMIFESCRIVYSGSSLFICSRFQSPKYAADTELPTASKKNFYTVLVNIGLVLLICGGILFFGGRNKEKTKDDNTAEKSVAVSEQKADNTKKPADKPKTDAEIAAQKKKEDDEKAKAAELAAKKKAEDDEKAKAAALAAKKKAEDDEKAKAAALAAKKKAEDDEKAKAAELAAKKKAEEEAKKKLAENSPWERPAADNYSPWIMNATERSAKDKTTGQTINQTGQPAEIAANNAVNTPAIPAAAVPAAAIPNPVNPYPPYSAHPNYTQPNYNYAQPVPSGYANSARYTPQYPAQVAGQYNGQYPNPIPQTSSPYQPQYNAGQYGQYGWSAHQQLGSNGAVSGPIPMRENPASYQTQYNQYSQYAATQPNPVYVAARPQMIPQQPSPQIPQEQPVVVPQYGSQPIRQPVPVQPIQQPAVSYPVPYSEQPYYPSAVVPAQIR